MKQTDKFRSFTDTWTTFNCLATGVVILNIASKIKLYKKLPNILINWGSEIEACTEWWSKCWESLKCICVCCLPRSIYKRQVLRCALFYFKDKYRVKNWFWGRKIHILQGWLSHGICYAKLDIRGSTVVYMEDPKIEPNERLNCYFCQMCLMTIIWKSLSTNMNLVKCCNLINNSVCFNVPGSLYLLSALCKLLLWVLGVRPLIVLHILDLESVELSKFQA